MIWGPLGFRAQLAHPGQGLVQGGVQGGAGGGCRGGKEPHGHHKSKDPVDNEAPHTPADPKGVGGYNIVVNIPSLFSPKSHFPG